MRKINKTVSIALIFMLIGVFLCQNLYALRIPMNGHKAVGEALQDTEEKLSFSNAINSQERSLIKLYGSPLLVIKEGSDIRIETKSEEISLFQDVLGANSPSKVAELIKMAILERNSQKKADHTREGYAKLVDSLSNKHFSIQFAENPPFLFSCLEDGTLIVHRAVQNIDDFNARQTLFVIGIGEALRRYANERNMAEIEIDEESIEITKRLMGLEYANIALYIRNIQGILSSDSEYLKKLKFEETWLIKQIEKPWIEDVRQAMRKRLEMDQKPRSIRKLKTYVRKRLSSKIKGDPTYAAGVEEELAQLDITDHNPIYGGRVSVFDKSQKGEPEELQHIIKVAQRAILEHCGIDIFEDHGEDSTILDIGIGGNYKELLFLLETFPEVERIYGIDIDNLAVDHVLAEIQKSGISPKDQNRLSIFQANTEDLREEFDDGYVNLIFAIKTIDLRAFEKAVYRDPVRHGFVDSVGIDWEPIESIVKNMIDEVYRILRPGDFAIMSGLQPTLEKYFKEVGFEPVPTNSETTIVMRKPIAKRSQVISNRKTAQAIVKKSL